MAVFNPTVPQGQDNMPNWTKVTSPVDSFLGDKSSGITAATIGQGIEGAANALEYDAKEVIKKDVRSTVEPIREDFTNTLAAAKDQLVGASVVPAPAQTAQGGAVSLAPEDQPAPPSAINKGISKVQSIQLAMENGKGVNDTYYDMRLKTAVTDLRTKYPGFVDYIDSEVSKITGINPANDLIKNYMQDINRLMTSKKTAVDTAIDNAMKSGYDYADAWVKKLQVEGDAALPGYREWYSRQTMIDSQMKRAQALREARKGAKEDVVADRKQDFTNEAGNKLSTHFDAMTTIPGIDTPQKILDVMADAQANPQKYTDEQMRFLATAVGTQKAIWETEMRKRAREVAKDGSGKSFSYNSDIGTNEVETTIKNLGQQFDLVRDALIKGGPEGMGLAYIHANRAKAILDAGKEGLVTDKDLGADAVFMANSRELFGDNWTNLTILNGIKEGLDKKIEPYVQHQRLKARIGRDENGNPVNLTQQIDQGKALENQGKITSNMRARYTNSLVHLADDITNKDSPVAAKEKIIDYIFSPEGQGLLSRFKTDYKDPVTGNDVPGKYTVFNLLTTNGIANEVKKMDAIHQQKYLNFLEIEAGKELFTKEFLNLNRYTGHDDLSFKYNDGAKGGVPSITLIDKNGKEIIPKANIPGQWGNTSPSQDRTSPYINEVYAVKERVNQAIAGMSRVKKALGGDVNEYVLDFLVNKAQVDLGTNWTGLPAKLVDAIASSRAPKKRIEDSFKELQ